VASSTGRYFSGQAAMDFLIFPTVQKKFLRYVLSRLNLFDTDKLDLDRLDVAWGKRSTVELRDVDFKLDVSGKK
jgi:autophagy-related protein 2